MLDKNIPICIFDILLLRLMLVQWQSGNLKQTMQLIKLFKARVLAKVFGQQL